MSNRVTNTSKLKYLRFNGAGKVNPANACDGYLIAMFSCWASSGIGSDKCAALVDQVKVCADSKPPSANATGALNYHASRMFPKLVGKYEKRKK
ncbi:hypothetical protein V1514DRAFT_338732 [Lipomyces japonicus]|uniref:uncharacterized protein n=1 Tax=Lipomyces japonicus TaxID=56871 RepID=UPI0034CF9CB7